MLLPSHAGGKTVAGKTLPRNLCLFTRKCERIFSLGPGATLYHRERARTRKKRLKVEKHAHGRATHEKKGTRV
jgi:hypothetical protein